MILYGYPLSPPSEGVRMGLKEKGLTFEYRGVDLTGGENRAPAFRALNYLGQIPVLQDGDLTLFESNVILEYVEEAYPERPLLPRDLPRRALTRQWVALLQLEWRGIRQVLYHEGLLKPLGLLPGPGDRKALMAARKGMIPHLSALEAQLARSAVNSQEPYLLGDFGLVDVLYAPTLYILEVGQLLPRDLPRIRRWMDALLARPAAPRWLEKDRT